MQRVDPLHQLLDAVDHRGELDPDGSVLPCRLDDQREADVLGMLEPPPEDRGEVGGRDAVEGEDLLGEGLVLGEVESLRAGARIAAAKEVEVRGDVRVLGVIAAVRFGEIEDQIGFQVGEGEQALNGAVEDRVEGIVSSLLQSLEDLLDVLRRLAALAPGPLAPRA